MSPVVARPIPDPLANLSSPKPKGSPSQAYEALIPNLTAVITGAGISTDSGIPDYRSPGSPERNPMTGDAFRASQENRRRYWARGYVGWERHQRFKPNSVHYDLASLKPASLITQNVDGLHEAAGSTSVVELHGSLHKIVCLSCGHGFHRSWMQRRLRHLNPGFLKNRKIALADVEINPDGDVELDEFAGFTVPPCPVCNGPLKPDVVYFGESVRPEVATAAERAVDDAESVLVLGSSLAVHSALRLVRRAAKDGKPVVIVTDGPTRADDLATVRVVDRVAPFVSGWKEHAARRALPTPN